MKKILLLFLFFCLSYPLTGHTSHWKFFEHRYKYKLEDVIDAEKFIKKDGYWEGYRDDKLVGYVFLSQDWTKDLVGYAAKHMETLIGMDTKGMITGVKLLFHSEPIVLIGLKEKQYLKFMEQYKDKDIKKTLSIGKQISMDAITGATITALVQNAIVTGSARKVASKTGMLQFAKGISRKISKIYNTQTWKELQDSKAIGNIAVNNKELGFKGDDIYIDLYFAIIDPPSIGINLLGDRRYKETKEKAKDGKSAILVASRGKGSFKGKAFARGGIFDRFSIEQEDRMYVFRDIDYRILTKIKAKGAPSTREGGVFIIKGEGFDPTKPFKFVLTLPYRVGFDMKFKSFSREYVIPDRFLE